MGMHWLLSFKKPEKTKHVNMFWISEIGYRRYDLGLAVAFQDEYDHYDGLSTQLDPKV